MEGACKYPAGSLLDRKKVQVRDTHWTENSKQIFPEINQHGLVPNFHIHVSVTDLYIPWTGLPILLQKIGGPIVGLYNLLRNT